MSTIAIIGTGIAGLGCGHFLRRDHELTLFEQADWVGGHANTVQVEEGGGRLPVDTGFMVYNEVTYPLLTRLFSELEVDTIPTSMSFSVRHDGVGLEYCGSSLMHLFAQRRNLLRPSFWRLLHTINCFNREALQALDDSELAGLSVDDYVREHGYGERFLELYLLPMSAAVWSAPPEKMRAFPAATLLRFFHNHGFLGLHTQHPWRTVSGGSRNYVEKLIRPFADRVRRGVGVKSVRRGTGPVRVRTTDGAEAFFDQVVFACHADQALALLEDPTPLEQRLLSAFRYQPNMAVLHTDASVMPRLRRTWASWNYRVVSGSEKRRSSTHYWMNSLQSLASETNYFVSINPPAELDPTKVLWRKSYDHPLFDVEAVRAQETLPELNRLREGQSTFYCGSYFRYGFHEDALRSAYDAVGAVLGREAWPDTPARTSEASLVKAGEVLR